MKRTVLRLLALGTVFGFAAHGGVIGNWSGSLRSWNNSDMSTLKAAMIGAGNTVLADSAITAGNLAGDNVFVIGEALSSPTAAEGTALANFVNGGGILLVLFDSGCSGCVGGNAALADVGSTMSASGANPVVAPFPGGIFATTGPPFNLVGQTLDTSPGSAIAGGIDIAGTYVAYQHIGSGFVFAFADRSDHNTFSPDNTHTNGKLFLNIVGSAAVVATPEPATGWLIGAGMGMLALGLRKRSR